MRLAALVLALLALTPAAAAASNRSVDIADFEFSPAALTVNPGDTVTWRWRGADRNHTVTSRPGQADSFESDPGTAEFAVQHPAGDTFAHAFATPGRFGYVCRVHPSMTGHVTVVAVADRVAPRLRSLEAGVAKLRFTLSEKASVTALVTRSGKTVKRLRIRGRKGVNSVKFPPRDLRAGRYRLAVSAVDALGNESKAARRSFEIIG